MKEFLKRRAVEGKIIMSKQVKPRNHSSVRKQYPAYIKALDALGKAVGEAGPLDEKVRHLVQLGAAAAIRSEGAVHSHARQALDAGATADEVRHAVICVTSTIGFPNVMASLSWTGDVIRKGRR